MSLNIVNRIIGRGFKGGPNALKFIPHRIELEQDVLEFSIPVVTAKNFPVNWPYSTNDLFEKSERKDMGQPYLYLNQQSYWYGGSFLKTAGHPLAYLTLNMWLKRVVPGQTIERHNLELLGRYIGWEYDDYYNAPEYNAETGRGWNTQRRDELRSPPLLMRVRTEEELDELMVREGKLMPEHFDITEIANQRWLLYLHRRSPLDIPARHYCYPLTSQHYLQIRFGYHDELGFPQYWEADARKAEQKIMQSMQLHLADRLGDKPGVILEHG